MGHDSLMSAFWTGTAVFLVLLVLYLFTLHRVLGRVHESRRAMAPGLVWLNLIPLFGFGWHLYTGIMMADSLAREFEARQIPHDGKPGLVPGLSATVLLIAGAIPAVGVFAASAGLICWIVYWVQIALYSRRIAAPA
jgi:hypothetical protein